MLTYSFAQLRKAAGAAVLTFLAGVGVTLVDGTMTTQTEMIAAAGGGLVAGLGVFGIKNAPLVDAAPPADPHVEGTH